MCPFLQLEHDSWPCAWVKVFSVCALTPSCEFCCSHICHIFKLRRPLPHKWFSHSAVTAPTLQGFMNGSRLL